MGKKKAQHNPRPLALLGKKSGSVSASQLFRYDMQVRNAQRLQAARAKAPCQLKARKPRKAKACAATQLRVALNSFRITFPTQHLPSPNWLAVKELKLNYKKETLSLYTHMTVILDPKP